MTPQQRAYLQFIAEKGKKTQQQTDQYRADMNKVEPKKEMSFDQWKAGRVPKLAIGGEMRNWMPGSVEEGLRILKRGTYVGNDPEAKIREINERYTPEVLQGMSPEHRSHVQDALKDMQEKSAINKWISGNLTNYVKKHMGSPVDPIRELFEQGIYHISPEQVGVNRYRAPEKRQMLGGKQYAKSDAAKAWEDATDVTLSPWNKELLKQHGKMEPWMEKLGPQDLLMDVNGISFEPEALGFDHILDVLHEDVKEGRIRPEQLNKMSMEQAVRRVHQYDQAKAKAMRETALKQTEGMPVVKEYDTGHKWIELTKPEGVPQGHTMTQDEEGLYSLKDPAGKEVGLGKTPEDATSRFNAARMRDALKYEGDTMGHCVGGYHDKVLKGESRIFSLRDAKGEPHVTIETSPVDMARAFGNLPEEERRDIEQHVKNTQFGGAMPGRSNEDAYWDALDKEYVNRYGKPADRIIQIKGKQNQKPKPEYMRMAQDFVKSGEWSDIGDHQNAGLIKMNEGSDMAKSLKAQGKPVPKYITESEHADWMADQLKPGMAKGGSMKVNMYSPLEKLANESPRAKGTPAEFMAEISKKPGFRQEEVADRKIPMPNQKMTKQQFIEHLNTAPAPLLDETVLGGQDKYWDTVHDSLSSGDEYKGYYMTDDGLVDPYGSLVTPSTDPMDAADYIVKRTSDPETKYEDYKMPGASNYREVLMKKSAQPNYDSPEFKKAAMIEYGTLDLSDAQKKLVANRMEGPTYQSAHWDDPNVLAHLRLTDRRGPKNEKLLHVEEMQSDWHQDGRKKGYGQEVRKPTDQEKDEWRRLEGMGASQRSVAEDHRLEELDHLMAGEPYGVPDAPFKKSWHELALKRAIKEAVEGGYQGLVITPGQEQNNRYSLSKHIDKLDYGMNEDGTYDVYGTKGGKQVIQHSGINPDELDKYVGKEVANRMISGAGEKSTVKSRFKPNAFARDYNTLEGLDLEVGGEGMKGFYDKIVPDYLNKLGKKYGTKVGKMPVKVDRSNENFANIMSRHTGMTLRDWDNLPNEERARLTPEILAGAKNQQVDVHHFPITEEMRQDIKTNGLPLYKKGGGIKLLPTRFKE